METGCSDETFQVKEVESGGDDRSGDKASERRQCSSTRRRPRRRCGKKPKRRVRKAPVHSEPPGGESKHISDTGLQHSDVDGEECGGKRPKLLTEDRRQDGEPVSGGGGEGQGEPVLGGGGEGQGESVSGGGGDGQGESVLGGGGEGQGEPVLGGGGDGRGEFVSGGGGEGQGESVSGGGGEGQGESVSGGGGEGQGETVSGGGGDGQGETVSGGGGDGQGESVSGGGGEKDVTFVKQSKEPAEDGNNTFTKEAALGGGQCNLDSTFVKDPVTVPVPCLEPHLPQAKSKAPSRRTARKGKTRPRKRCSHVSNKGSETEVCSLKVVTTADDPTDTNTQEAEGSTAGGRDEGSTTGGREEGSTEGGRDEGSTEGGGDEGSTTGGRDDGSTTGGRDEGSTTGGRDEGSTTGGREGSPEIPLQNSAHVSSDQHVGASRLSKLSATLCRDSSLLPATKRRKTLPSKRARETSQLSIVDTEVTSHMQSAWVIRSLLVCG